MRDAMSMAIRSAVTSGIRDAIQDKALLEIFWQKAFEKLQEDSTNYAKKFLWARIKDGLNKGVSFFIIGMIIYSIGGWSAVHKLWIAIIGK